MKMIHVYKITFGIVLCVVCLAGCKEVWIEDTGYWDIAFSNIDRLEMSLEYSGILLQRVRFSSSNQCYVDYLYLTLDDNDQFRFERKINVNGIYSELSDKAINIFLYPDALYYGFPEEQGVKLSTVNMKIYKNTDTQLYGAAIYSVCSDEGCYPEVNVAGLILDNSQAYAAEGFITAEDIYFDDPKVNSISWEVNCEGRVPIVWTAKSENPVVQINPNIGFNSDTVSVNLVNPPSGQAITSRIIITSNLEEDYFVDVFISPR